ncbi:hypothetical protein AB1A64_12450 [Ruegeria sp. ANG10]|uniref:hypothetical protein n=1 Tax=Ruegeria sp. ANG10 TaxID=3042467 RepID=UPI003456D8FE
MILDTLFVLSTFALFILTISLLPLLVFACWRYTRSKRAVIEGMAQLDSHARQQMGWMPKEYLGTFDVRAPIRLGWQSWGLMWRQQNTALHRVLWRGLPNAAEVPEDIRKSARRFRRYFCFFIAPLTALVLLPAFLSLAQDMADLTGFSTRICYILLGLCIGLMTLLPLEKFQKWPELGEGT